MRECLTLALICLHVDSRYRESHDEDERPVHPGRRRAGRACERAHSHFPEGLGEDFLCFQHGFSGLGDDRCEPHFTVPAQCVGVRAGPHAEDFQIRNAERDLVPSLDFLSHDRPLEFVVHAEPGARDFAEQTLGVAPVGLNGLPGPIKLEFASVVADIVALRPSFQFLRGTGERLAEDFGNLGLGVMRRQRRVVARHPDQPGVFELIHDRHEIDDVASSRDGHGPLQIGFRLRQQVKPHFRDHAEVAL